MGLWKWLFGGSGNNSNTTTNNMANDYTGRRTDDNYGVNAQAKVSTDRPVAVTERKQEPTFDFGEFDDAREHTVNITGSFSGNSGNSGNPGNSGNFGNPGNGGFKDNKPQETPLPTTQTGTGNSFVYNWDDDDDEHDHTVSLWDSYPKKSSGAFSAPTERIILQNTSDASQVFTLSINRELLVGRDPACCSVVIYNDSFVSKKHATIVKNNSVFCVRDEGSTNGTFVNGKQVKKLDAFIREGDIVTFGHTSFKFSVERPESD